MLLCGRQLPLPAAEVKREEGAARQRMHMRQECCRGQSAMPGGVDAARKWGVLQEEPASRTLHIGGSG